jgi:hypothetical protein
MGPNSTTPKGTALLGYHLTVDAQGKLVKVQPDFDFPKGDLGNAWGSAVYATVADFAYSCDYDALVIHTPKEQNMELTARQAILVGILRSVSVANIGSLVLGTGAPAATIRRNIGALRNKGFNIEATGHGYQLLSELGNGTVATSPAQSEEEDLKDEYGKSEYYEDNLDTWDDGYGDEVFFDDGAFEDDIED